MNKLLSKALMCLAIIAISVFQFSCSSDDDDVAESNQEYSISGNPTITNKSGETYIVKGLPTRTYTSWEISDKEHFKISQNGYNSVLVFPQASGYSATLTATIESTTSKISTTSIVITSKYE